MSFADRFIIDDVGERKRRLQDYVLLVAGIDPQAPDKVRFLPIGPAGVKVDISGGGEQLPIFDSLTVDMYGSTNNVHHVHYRVGGAAGTVVATRTISYVGAGAADNDVFLSSELTYP